MRRNIMANSQYSDDAHGQDMALPEALMTKPRPNAADVALNPKPKVEHLPLAVRVSVAVRMIGIGRSKLCALMASGDIEAAKIGTSRIIIAARFQRLIGLHRC